ncbi:hypothetical protein G6F37_014181 [Rhizopus arrhizus]|nr:hypothetical protein G6F38_014060 [Rhizopus arrhizus]KAG1128554.1 hypothetical protein G6F37_014181 [Rhizopus arrhizus]
MDSQHSSKWLPNTSSISSSSTTVSSLPSLTSFDFKFNFNIASYRSGVTHASRQTSHRARPVVQHTRLPFGKGKR